MAAHKVGGEVDAFCTRCKLHLAHTILAMVGSKIVRVRCNTCGGDHAFRSTPARTKAPSAARATPERVVISFEQQLAGKDLSKAAQYSPKEAYQVDQLIDHPSFGLGIVMAVREDKVDVAFKAVQKTLVHRRSGAPSPRPTFHPPPRPEDSSEEREPATDSDGEGGAPRSQSGESSA